MRLKIGHRNKDTCIAWMTSLIFNVHYASYVIIVAAVVTEKKVWYK